MPNQTVYFPHPHRLQGILAVVNPKPGLEINGVLRNLVFHQEHQLFAFQQRPQIQALQVGAEILPVGIMQIDMVFPANIFTLPNIIMQIFQLILAVNVMGQNWVFQILKKVLADDGIFEVGKLAEPLLLRIERHIAVMVVVRKEAEGQLFKRKEVLPEEIWVFFQQLAVTLIAPLQKLKIRFVKNLDHQGQDILPEMPFVEQLGKCGI